MLLRWRVRIRVDGKHQHLGYFDSEIEAAGAYDAAGLARDPEFFTPNLVFAIARSRRPDQTPPPGQRR